MTLSYTSAIMSVVSLLTFFNLLQFFRKLCKAASYNKKETTQSVINITVTMNGTTLYRCDAFESGHGTCVQLCFDMLILGIFRYRSLHELEGEDKVLLAV